MVNLMQFDTGCQKEADPEGRSAAGAKNPRRLVANPETLHRLFIRPENEAARTALIKYMEQILFGLHDFLQNHVGFTEEASLKALADRFVDSRISPEPARHLADVINSLIEEIAPHAVNVASPYFIGHMTSAIPYFMVHLATIVAALNQNPVKLETSKVVSIHERQVIARLHRLVFNLPPEFYKTHIQRPESTLGGVVEDGTIANLTALWVARNRLFPARGRFPGVERAGMAAAFSEYGIDRCVVLVSRMAHYSLEKSAGVLGLGSDQVISVDVDSAGRMRVDDLARRMAAVRREGRTRILAVVGIAGTTETGAVDPLPEIADCCQRAGVHFHVDAAWGGPTLLSERHRHQLDGISRADSVTIDGHKQLYLPMSCGVILFRAPQAMDAVAYHAAYINRPGSVDLGIRSLSGSRPATSLILGEALEIMGAKGYALLIDHGIALARAFADKIRAHPLFELITPPQLNILTYRLLPPSFRSALETADPADRAALTERINDLNVSLQRLQREAGRSFVSRTTLRRAPGEATVVLRAVLMNPMTDPDILDEILAEQAAIYHEQLADITYKL